MSKPTGEENKCCQKCNFKGVEKDTKDIVLFSGEYCGKKDCECHATPLPKDIIINEGAKLERVCGKCFRKLEEGDLSPNCDKCSLPKEVTGVAGTNGRDNPVHIPPTGVNGYGEVVGCQCEKFLPKEEDWEK